MIYLLVILGFIQLLVAALAGSLRYLNFSQLQKKFELDEYSFLVEQLKNRDEVEVLSWSLSTFLAIVIVGTVVLVWNVSLTFLVVAAICASLINFIFPLILIAPWAERVLIELMPLYRMIESLPLAVRLISGSNRLSRRLAGESEHEALSLEMTHLIMEGEAEGTVDASQKKMLQRVIDLKDKAVREVMTPRANLFSLSQGALVREGIALAAEHGLSRLPIYDPDSDQVKGVFFVRDVLKKLTHQKEIMDSPVDVFMRQVPVVPEIQSIGSLLKTISKSRNQILIVHDEYGGLAGIVTLEDIIEEIVGEIRDEYADETTTLTPLGDRSWEVRGWTRLEEVNKALDLQLQEDLGFETLAGFLIYKIQKIPQKGESFVFDNCRFVVLEATSRRVEKIRLEILS